MIVQIKLKIHQVGVPQRVAEILTYLEKGNPANVQQMKQLVRKLCSAAVIMKKLPRT